MEGIESLSSDDNVFNEFKNKFNELKDEVKNKLKGKEKGISKSPYLQDGAVIFDYKDDSGDWQIVTRYEDNNYKVRVKKFEKVEKLNGKKDWVTKGVFKFKASNKKLFNLELGTVLNKTIGENRYKIPETSGKVYDLLNKDKKTENKNNSKDSKKSEDKKNNKNNKESRKNNNKQSEKFDKKYEKQYGVELIRDGKLTFYVVKSGERLKHIKNKLSRIPEFSYLKSGVYNIPESGDGRNIRGFNIPDKSLKEGFYLPIPLKESERKISVSDFKKKAKRSLDDMMNNKFYGKKLKILLERVNEKDVISIMAAYARSESGGNNLPIGYYVLHRREPTYKAFSFSYFHILMGSGPGSGPGMIARKKLGLSEGDCYDPVNACKLFLGYCFEKRFDPIYFFNIKNKSDASRVGCTYNGAYDYGEKLWKNLEYCKTVK